MTDRTRLPTLMQPVQSFAATIPQQQTTTATTTAAQTLHKLPQTTPTAAEPTTNTTLTPTYLSTTQHQWQPTTTPMVPQTTPTEQPTTTTDTLPMTTPLTLTIDTSSITASFVRHHQTLDHLENNIQRLSHTMAKLNTLADEINNMIMQQTTDAQLIAAAATSTPTFPSPNSSNAKQSYPQQSPATVSPTVSQTSRVPPKPPDPATNSKPTTDTSATHHMRTQWSFAPCPTDHNLPFPCNHMLANMRPKPQPSRRFMTMLRHTAKNNYRPP